MMTVSPYADYAARKLYQLDQERLARSEEVRYRLEWLASQERETGPPRQAAYQLGTLLVQLGERLRGWAALSRAELERP